jgi:hypothetical protein
MGELYLVPFEIDEVVFHVFGVVQLVAILIQKDPNVDFASIFSGTDGSGVKYTHIIIFWIVNHLTIQKFGGGIDIAIRMHITHHLTLLNTRVAIDTLEAVQGQ